MRHTYCTDISINNSWCWFVEWRRAKWIEQSTGVRHIDDKSLQVWHKYRYIIYVIWGGRAIDMSRGQGGGRQGETTFICSRVIEMRSECISMGGSATCSDGDGDAAARNREIENGLRVSAPIPSESRWITAIVNFAKRMRTCENVYRVSSPLSRISARLDWVFNSCILIDPRPAFNELYKYVSGVHWKFLKNHSCAIDERSAAVPHNEKKKRKEKGPSLHAIELFRSIKFDFLDKAII